MSCKPLALSTGHEKYLMQMNRPILLQSHITEESSGMLGPHVPQKALQVGLFPGSHPAFHGLQYRWQLTQWHRNHRGRGASTHMKFLQLKISTCPHTGAHILHTAHNDLWPAFLIPQFAVYVFYICPTKGEEPIAVAMTTKSNSIHDISEVLRKCVLHS